MNAKGRLIRPSAPKLGDMVPAMNLPPSLVKRIASNWPFANGSGRFIDKFGRKAQFGSSVMTCRTSDEFEIDVLGNDHIGRHLLISGEFDRSVIQVLLDFAKGGDCVLDIGANIGYVSCCLLKNIAGSHVICIEPQPIIIDLLRRNLSRFDASRSRIIDAALSDRDGEVVLNIDDQNRGASSIHAKSGDASVTVQSVSAERLFSSFSSLDLIKIDVEGHEEHVIRSAAGQLARLKPRAILFEDRVGGAWPGGAIGKILTNLGYTVYGIKKSLTSTSLVVVKSAQECFYNDYLAVSKEFSIPPEILARYSIN